MGLEPQGLGWWSTPTQTPLRPHITSVEELPEHHALLKSQMYPVGQATKLCSGHRWHVPRVPVTWGEGAAMAAGISKRANSLNVVILLDLEKR
jgi:hypothetical protein